jgi:hypothetical protein
MRKLLLSAVALVVLFAACSKDDDKNTPETPQAISKYLLHQVSPHDSLEAVYDAANNMKEVKTWNLASSSTSTAALVYENGKLTKITRSSNGGEMRVVRTLTYNSAGKLSTADFYNPNGEKATIDSLVYDAEGHLAALYKAFYHNDAYEFSEKFAYIWDNKGNIVREVHVNISNGIESTDSTFNNYTYDDKVNFGSKQPEFFLQEPEDPIFGLCANNVVKVAGGYNTIPDWSSVTTKTYTYDEDGYPITRKDVGQIIQGGVVTSTYEDSFRFRYIRQ